MAAQLRSQPGPLKIWGLRQMAQRLPPLPPNIGIDVEKNLKVNFENFEGQAQRR